MTTVLLVEDEPINVRVFSKILTKRAGLEVKHTEDVEEVMAIAQAGIADIILMDVSLAHSTYHGKRVDGIRITQMLKANLSSAKVPVILVTANATLSDREEFLKASGADELIPKPIIDQQKFVDKILSFLP
jgi:two-component system, cell cycle response regulator DivK